MKIERTKDYDLVDSILNIPHILETISPSKLDKPFKTARDDRVYYLLPIHDDEVVGVFIVHRDSPCSYKIHANIPKQYRIEHSESACNSVIEWIWENINTNKINAEIPTIYPNVIERSLKSGFELEGILRKYYLKEGQECDVAFMGIVRPERI